MNALNRLHLPAIRLGRRLSGSSLVDSFGRVHDYLRVSLTERCNLRCRYCMPAEGVALTDKQALLSADELDVLIQVFVDCGVNKIRFTGGEPTVRKELVDIVRRTDALRSKGTLKTIAMTSNGVALRSKLEELVDAGLDQLNISLDTLDPLRFPLLTRRNGHNLVIQTIDAATKFLERKGDKNLKALKVNCVLMRGINDDELPKFIEMTRERDLEVRFIEYMPFDGNMWSKDKLISYAEMLERSKTAFPGLERAEEIPKDAHGQVSKVWRVPGFKGRVGFITSMTEHFCGTCNRLRLMADGNLKVCLFGASEVNLRDKLRSGKLEEIRSIIEAAVLRKKKSHAGMDEIWNNAKKNRPMITIGGANARFFSSSSFSHINSSGAPTMVDISQKPSTHRSATSIGFLKLPVEMQPFLDTDSTSDTEIFTGKGPVFSTAIIAGTMAVKKTSEIIPFCHPLLIKSCKFDIALEKEYSRIRVTCTVKVEGNTGVEMEALTGVSSALLCIYDMLKAKSHQMVISDISLVSKTGGKSDINGDALKGNS